MAPVNLAEKYADKKILIVGVPGAYTPTCSKQLPGDGYICFLDSPKA